MSPLSTGLSRRRLLSLFGASAVATVATVQTGAAQPVEPNTIQQALAGLKELERTKPCAFAAVLYAIEYWNTGNLKEPPRRVLDMLASAQTKQATTGQEGAR